MPGLADRILPNALQVATGDQAEVVIRGNGGALQQMQTGKPRRQGVQRVGLRQQRQSRLHAAQAVVQQLGTTEAVELLGVTAIKIVGMANFLECLLARHIHRHIPRDRLPRL